MLEFGNQSRSARRRRLAEQRRSSVSRPTRKPVASTSPDPASQRASDDARRRRMYVSPSNEPLRLVPGSPSGPRRSGPPPEPSRMRRPSSAFMTRLGSMGLAPEPTAAPRRPVPTDAQRSLSPAKPPVAVPPKNGRTVSPNRSRHSAASPATRVAATAKADRARSERPESPVRRKTRSQSAFLYAVRTLILVVGVGAIAGTLLSAINPSGQIADASQQSPSTSSSEVSSAPNSMSSGLGLANIMSSYTGRELTALKQEILGMSDLYTDLTPGVFMLDLDTGNTLNINGETTFAAASMIKVPVLVAFFQDVDAGRIRLDEVLTMEEEDLASGSGEMQFDGIGTEYTALETATLMIIISDNTATNILIRRMGGLEALNQRFRSWGLQQTTLNNLLPDLEGTNTTSPKELAGLMTMVSRGELISMRSRDRMLDIMRRTYTDTLIPTGVGDPEATISHKTGDIGELVGDVGLVDMPNGKRYAITTLMKRPFNDDRAQEWIRQINGMVYDELKQNQEPTLFDVPSSTSPNSSDATTGAPTPTESATESPSTPE